MATFYDLEFEGKLDDLDFYRQIARRIGGPILELGCGTGRVTIPLARDGRGVVGIDRSAAQLERAKRKAEEAAVDVRFVLGDFRDFALPEPFRLVLIPFATFLILAPEERPACLARVREHLGRDGRFVLDVFQPDPDIIAAKEGALVQNWMRADPETGRTVTKSSASEADVDGVTDTVWYDEVDAGGIVRRLVRRYRLFYLYRRELEFMLANAGFAIESFYGSYDLEPVATRSPRLIAVARRRDRAGDDRRRGA